MEVITVPLISSLVSAIVGALVGAVVSRIKTAKDRDERSRTESEQTLMLTCRMAIYDEHFSVDEKLEAYEIYSGHGWNHQTKTYMDGLVGGDVDEYLEKHCKR